MKGKMSTKAIVIAILTVVLLGAGVGGAVIFLKDSGEAAAKTEDERPIESVTLPTDDDGNQVGTNNTDTAEATGNNNDGAVPQDTASTEQSGTATASTVNPGTGTTTTTTDNDVPNQEYIQTSTQTRTEVTEEPWYTKSVGWVPKTLEFDVNDIDINKGDVTIRKTAKVNDDEFVTTVFKDDIITYKIYVKNTGKIDLESIHISDSIPVGTTFVDNSIDNNGTISPEGEITWIKDVKKGEEIVVSYKVKVVLGADAEGRNITQIDNTAIVDGNNTNTTHNPTITYNKEVKVISVNGQELNNQIVIPGTRLRYYINLTNTSVYDAVTRVTDTIPEGTSLINGTISEGGELNGNKIIWKNVSIPAGETARVYFDVTVNNNRKDTVSNVAYIGAEISDSTEGRATNTVKTPVLSAAKESIFDYNSNTQTPKLHEKNEVTYVVTIKNSASKDDSDVSNLSGVAKLQDIFWTEDLNKMTFKSGELVVTDENDTVILQQQKPESFLSNINVTLKAGEKATLTYIYTINEMQNPTVDNLNTNKIEWDEISNNLYWTEPTGNDPSRPQNSNDTTNNKNTDKENDPTLPTADPQDPEKPGLIDTVIIHVEEENIDIEAIKEWMDYYNQYLKRPDFVTFTLYRNGESTDITLNPSKDNDWKVVFSNLRKTDLNGTDYIYSIMEDNVTFYKPIERSILAVNNKITVTNYLDQLFIAEKESSKEGQTVKENENIDYKITVYNIGDEDGTTYIKDVYRNNDEDKLQFKNGVVEYYDNFNDETPTSTENINQNYLDSKIALNIKGNGKAVIKYNCTTKVIDANKEPDSDGKIRDNITNDLFWEKENTMDPDDPRYPTDQPIDTVVINLEKEYTQILATKIWDDETDTSNRPETIKFTLQRNGQDTSIEKTLSSANAVSNNPNKWQVTFDNLLKYDENGREYNYTIKEDPVEHYISRYSEDRRTVTNMVGENIEAQVITSNANIPTVPMDVVFVIDISSSMLDDPINKNLTTGSGSNKSNRVDSAKAIKMVDAVNTAIDEVLSNNPNNRIAVQLYNARVTPAPSSYYRSGFDYSSNSTYYLIELGNYEKREDGKYIKFDWSQQGAYYETDVKRYDGILTTNVNDKMGVIVEAKKYEEYWITGTYTQAGIQRGEQILTGASNKAVPGKDYNRIPVMILLTDGDPTNYTKDTIGTNTIKEFADTPHDSQGNPSYGRVPSITAEYYYYTMKQIERSKEKITAAYNVNSSIPRACRFYTIGVGMKGCMADALLNPTSALINGLDTNPNEFDSVENYNSKKKKLKRLLQGEGDLGALKGNYTDKAFTTTGSSLAELEGYFSEAIGDAGEAIENKTIGEDRRIDLTEIAVNKKFAIKIEGTDFDDNTISINRSYGTFTQATYDTTVNEYIKGTTENYYIDLSNLKSGTVTVSYVKDNEV